MMTVHEVAEHYGVSDAFMVRALDRIGFKNAEPDTGLPTPTVTRFEAAFGDKIRAAQPKPPHPVTAESDTKPAAARSVRQPKPPVMRVAHAKVTSGRDASGHRAKRLLENPGLVHAIDAAGTNDGDPWDGEVVPGEVYFYDGPMNSGPTAACGCAHMRAVLGDEFVPADDPAKAGQCPRCATAVSEGKGFRTPPHEREYRSYFCEAYLRLRIDGSIEVQDCSLRDFHRGPHRTREGATWDIGFDDYVPTSLDTNRRITKAS
jgi:hypothetical protein